MQQKNSRFSIRHFQPQRWNLQAIPKTRQQDPNHPPNIIKQLPKSVEQRLSNHSSNETIFNEAAPPYEKAISEAGYDVILKYNPNKKTKQKNKKKKDNMVQSTILQKFGNRSWSLLFKIIR